MQIEAALSSPMQLASAPLALPGETQEALRLGQLLCSRVCHDLIGPASAINAGEELIREDDGTDPGEAHELIAESARQLAARLAFYRMAFGFGGGAEGVLTLDQVHAATASLLAGGRVHLDWRVERDAAVNRHAFPADVMRMLLCLVLIAAEALPRGGLLQVAVDASSSRLDLSLAMSGRSAGVPGDVISAVASSDLSAATPRTIHAFYLAAIARRLDASVRVHAPGNDVVGLQASVPFVFDLQAN